MKKLISILFVLVFIITGCESSYETVLEKVIIMENSELETTAYFYNKDGDGKRFVIVGGIHGNETAGFIAADEMMNNIVKDYPETSILFIPHANELGIKQEKRYADGYEDLNRTFNAELIDNETKKLANEIKIMILDFKPIFVLDHHESINNYLNKETNYRLGNTIIVSDVGENIMDTLFILDNVNEKIIDDIPFILESNAPEGSLNKTLSEALNIFVATIETNRKLSIEKRVEEQKIVASEILKYFLKDSD